MVAGYQVAKNNFHLRVIEAALSQNKIIDHKLRAQALHTVNVPGIN